MRKSNHTPSSWESMIVIKHNNYPVFIKRWRDGFDFRAVLLYSVRIFAFSLPQEVRITSDEQTRRYVSSKIMERCFWLSPECPRIVSRKEWKARKRLDFQILPVTPTPYVVIHHGGIRRYCRDQEGCSAIVRSYQDFHLDDRGWWDIGYNFLIGEDGNAYEGRGWNYVGAHAPGYNTQSIGICLLGDFSGIWD